MSPPSSERREELRDVSRLVLPVAVHRDEPRHPDVVRDPEADLERTPVAAVAVEVHDGNVVSIRKDTRGVIGRTVIDHDDLAGEVLAHRVEHAPDRSALVVDGQQHCVRQGGPLEESRLGAVVPRMLLGYLGRRHRRTRRTLRRGYPVTISTCGPSMPRTEQYFSSDSSMARATASGLTPCPVTT